jgi:hypothetical protein
MRADSVTTRLGFWVAQYLARGFDVVATDPAPNAEENLRKYVDEAWEQLTILGLTPGASRDRLSFTTNDGILPTIDQPITTRI